MFGAALGFLDSGNQLDSVNRSQVVAQGFAFVAESGGGEAEKIRGIRDAKFGRGVARSQTNYGAVDLGRRAERGFRNGEKNFNVRVKLGLHAEISEIAIPGRRGEAGGDFGLDQEHGAGPVVSQAKKLLQDRRGDVIRQIPRDNCGTPRTQIGLENVAFDQEEAALLDRFLEFLAQVVDQIRIDLNRDRFRRALQQWLGEGAFAGTDFNDQRSGVRTCRGRDAIENRFASEEMLTQAPWRVS